MTTLTQSWIKGMVMALACAAGAWAADPSGTWTWSNTGPRGRENQAKATLKLENGQLTGFIENRAGKTEIKDGKFEHDTVSFTATFEVRRRTLTATYTGKLEGDTIKGTIAAKAKSEKSMSVEWDAQRVK